MHIVNYVSPAVFDQPFVMPIPFPLNLPQGLMKTGGSASVQASLAKVKTEAERLDVMDKAAGILGELLYTDQLLSQIKEYRTIMLPVSIEQLVMYVWWLVGCTSLSTSICVMVFRNVS